MLGARHPSASAAASPTHSSSSRRATRRLGAASAASLPISARVCAAAARTHHGSVPLSSSLPTAFAAARPPAARPTWADPTSQRLPKKPSGRVGCPSSSFQLSALARKVRRPSAAFVLRSDSKGARWPARPSRIAAASRSASSGASSDRCSAPMSIALSPSPVTSTDELPPRCHRHASSCAARRAQSPALASSAVRHSGGSSRGQSGGAVEGAEEVAQLGRPASGSVRRPAMNLSMNRARLGVAVARLNVARCQSS
mmetsp:Transcript_38651/g.87798  ORF Transcript_38651/g.87798 Transcript_38651/m.87798 type:complete len:256 (-) Transcript_38651:570-1337(-)